MAVLDEEPENNENYGARRVYMRLTQQEYGYTGSYSTVYRVMKENGLLKKKKRNPNSLTIEDRKAQKSENIIKQDFSAEAPNEKWLTDITEILTADGKLYISPVLDCFDGKIVGLAMDGNMKKELCINAFEHACKSQGAGGMILHSDRGSQYTSNKFRETLNNFGAIQSMSGTGKCYDNARMESFFATLKKEKLYRIKTESLRMDTVKSIVFKYIFSYYNRKRVCSFNESGYPPDIKREMYTNRQSGCVAA